MEKIRIKMHDLLLCLSDAQDMVSSELSNHHQQTAYLSFRLAEHLGLSQKQKCDVYLAALIHDIGALSVGERLEIIESEPIYINRHAYKGAALIENFGPLRDIADIIKYHHYPWKTGSGMQGRKVDVPYASYIIHLADRVCLKIKPGQNILSQLPEILTYADDHRDALFEPGCTDALFELGKKEYIWFDLTSDTPVRNLPDEIFETLVLDIDDIIDIAYIFSQIIDFRSRFTAWHSAGVARTAEKLAEYAGFSPFECKMMLVAGYLHDLGKLTIDNKVLEKPSGLNEQEFSKIRSHTYYTYRLLEKIPQFDVINKWASFHHEKLDGTGYPFHIKGENLSLGSRIMAAADIFTAITENRPYREGMDEHAACSILKKMAAEGALDSGIINILINHYSEINLLRETAQKHAAEKYENFISS